MSSAQNPLSNVEMLQTAIQQTTFIGGKVSKPKGKVR
jgi:hypothetical protein